MDVFSDDKTRAAILRVVAFIFEATACRFQYIILTPHGSGPLDSLRREAPTVADRIETLVVRNASKNH